MPRLKPVTGAEILDVHERLFDIIQDTHDITRRLDSGTSFTESLCENPIETASHILTASMALAELAKGILAREKLKELKIKTEKEMRTRLSKGAALSKEA